MVILVFLLATLTVAQIPDAIRAAPADVRTFIERRQSCNHWGGEDPYDAARATEVESAARALRCTRLGVDEKALRRRHARNPAVQDLLTRTAEWIE